MLCSAQGFLGKDGQGSPPYHHPSHRSKLAASHPAPDQDQHPLPPHRRVFHQLKQLFQLPRRPLIPLYEKAPDDSIAALTGLTLQESSSGSSLLCLTDCISKAPCCAAARGFQVICIQEIIGLQRHPAALNGCNHRLGTIVHFHLLKDGAHVVLHGLLTNEEEFANHLVALALCH